MPTLAAIHNRHGLAYQWALITAAVTLIAFVLVAGSWTWKLDQVLYDAGLALHERTARDDVVIVAIDDASIDATGRWPWRRAALAALITRIAEAKPKAVAVDILLAEPDDQHPGDDKLLADVLRRAPNAMLPVVSLQGRELLPFKSISDRIRLVSVEAPLDPDSILRCAHLWSNLSGQRREHMAVALAQVGNAKLHVPNEQDYLIPFVGRPGSIKHLSAAAVLRGEIGVDQLAGKLVLVGVTAHGLADRYATPSTTEGEQMAGVEVTANILSGLLDERRIELVGQYTVGLISAAAILLLLLIFYRVGPTISLTVMFATVMLTPLLALVLLGREGIWFPPVSASVSALIAYPLWSWRRLEAICHYLDEEIVKMESDRKDGSQVLRFGTVGLADYIQNRLELIRLNINYLRSAQKFLGESLDGLPYAALVVAPGGRLVVANQRALGLCRLNKSELTTYGVASALRHIQAEGLDWIDAIATAQRGNELDIKAIDYYGHSFEVAIAPFRNDDGAVSGLIVVIKDVTELLHAQREREDALSFLSHDIRSPQNSIMALAELQRNEGVRKPETEFVTDVEALAKKTVMLAEDFLQLARADSKELNFEEYDLRVLVDDCVADIEPQARARQIVIDAGEVADEIGIRADRSLLVRAIGNLLINAVKYSPDGAAVTINCSVNEGKAICSIVDQGSGIQESDLPKLFRRFSRAQRGNSRIGGSGMGLAFVDVVARRHGGKVQVTSVPGSGSTFSLIIPRLEM